LTLAPDFDRYSCANTGERSVYEIMRSTLDEMFGEDSADAIGRAGAQPR
jgi:hypothetical protein